MQTKSGLPPSILVTDFRDRFIWSSLPFSEKQLVKIQDYKQKIIDELRFQQLPASKQFTDFPSKVGDLIDEMQRGHFGDN